jgi:RNA polymerase II elongation factor ELL
MPSTTLPAGGIALHGAPDSDLGSKDAQHAPVQAMQLEMTQDMVDELLESVRSGKPPQLFFGRTPVCVPSLSARQLSFWCGGVVLYHAGEEW